MKVNTNGESWRSIKKWAEEQLSEMRIKNDSDLDEKETAKLRGRIEFANELLELGQQKSEKTEQVADTTYID